MRSYFVFKVRPSFIYLQLNGSDANFKSLLDSASLSPDLCAMVVSSTQCILFIFKIDSL